ncbi:type II toxin-antitoxin system PemK/MazF family toxin [Candidatus Pacearchaeota archaeon]|nr:type II toxin-antitoxin system PemK/MazF family toxin [Candidatus Pacearchaeota archaeon]
MEGFVKGDIVVIDFPFSNLMQIKKRPALIIKIPKSEDVIVSPLTSKSHQRDVEISINEKDFRTGKLKMESYLRIDKIFSIEKSLIKYKVGALNRDKFESIVSEICSFLKS